MVTRNIDHLEDLLESLLSHLKVLVNLLAHLSQINLCLSFMEVEIMRSIVVAPNFLSDSFERESNIALMSRHLLLEEGLDLGQRGFNLVVMLICSLKVRFWVLVNHVVEMVIVSEESINWVEDLS